MNDSDINEKIISFEEMLDMLSIEHWNNHSLNSRVCICPRCHHKKFTYSVAKNYGRCYRASCDFRANTLTFYAECMGVDNSQAFKDLLRGDISSPNYIPPKPIESVTLSEPADFEKCNRINRAILKKMPLKEKHVKDMQKRGLSREEVLSLGYGSYEYDPRLGIKLRNEGDFELGVAGLYEDPETKDPMVKKTACGILVPYVNERRQIISLQIRKDTPQVIPSNWEKYIYFSSSSENKGAKCPQVFHLACDWNKDGTPILPEEVRITEGAMKADIAHIVTGETFVAVPGINNLGAVPYILEYLYIQGVKTIVDTYDMDYITNESVSHQMDVLKRMVTGTGLQYIRRDWNPEYKGYDDFVVHVFREK